MGQAKRRGSIEDRIAQSRVRRAEEYRATKERDDAQRLARDVATRKAQAHYDSLSIAEQAIYRKEHPVKRQHNTNDFMLFPLSFMGMGGCWR